MKRFALFPVFAAALLAGTAHAHSDEYLATVKAPNGGQLRMAGVYHLELVVAKDSKEAKENAIVVYVTDHADKKVDTKGMSATATLLAGKFKASGTGQGGIWHLAIAGFLRDQKVDPAALPWVPSNGAAPGLNDLVAGGVEVVPCSLPEARALIEAGKVRPLAIMADQPAKLFPNVPTLKAATGSNWTVGAWRGMAAPRNIPPEARDNLGRALGLGIDAGEADTSSPQLHQLWPQVAMTRSLH